MMQWGYPHDFLEISIYQWRWQRQKSPAFWKGDVNRNAILIYSIWFWPCAELDGNIEHDNAIALVLSFVLNMEVYELENRAERSFFRQQLQNPALQRCNWAIKNALLIGWYSDLYMLIRHNLLGIVITHSRETSMASHNGSAMDKWTSISIRY